MYVNNVEVLPPSIKYSRHVVTTVKDVGLPVVLIGMFTSSSEFITTSSWYIKGTSNSGQSHGSIEVTLPEESIPTYDLPVGLGTVHVTVSII